MGKLLAIAHNTFLQTIRQPVYCILILAMFVVLVLTLPASGWSMGEVGGDYHETDQKMLETLGLSTLLVLGSLLAAFSASAALAREIEDKTALTVISKPVPRSIFVLGKFAGVAAATALAYYLGTLAFLMTVKHQVMSAVTEPFDWPVIVIGCSGLGLALLVAIGGNFLFSWPFTSAFVWSCAACLSVAMTVILFVGKDWQPVPPGYDVPPKVYNDLRVRVAEGQDLAEFKAYAKEQKFGILRSIDAMRLVILTAPELSGGRGRMSVEEAIATVAKWKGVADVGREKDQPVLRPALLAGVGLTFLSLMVLVAVAVTASTRLGLVLTLMVCGGFFWVGSWHSYLFGGAIHNPVLQMLSWVSPKLGYFYSVDVLARPFEAGIPARFVATVALYCLLYVGGVLAVGIALFQRREMAAEGGGASVPGAVNLLAGLGRAAALIMGLVAIVLLGNPGAFTPTVPTPGNSNPHGVTDITTWLLTVGGLLAGAVPTWLLWGYFAKGAKWSYWVVTVLTAMGGVFLVASLLGFQAMGELKFLAPQSAALGVMEAIAAAAVMLILVLPKTRRHFRSQK